MEVRPKLKSIIGLKKSTFDEFVKSKDVTLREARLIPIYKLGNEMALTSVLLVALRLINEFRKMVLSEVKMTAAGQLFVYTEAEFADFPKARADGLILIVRGGVIKDAAICEMKNGVSELEADQIERYQEIAKAYGIPRIITVSNQFVSEATQCPVVINRTKHVDLYHLSWSYILTLAHVLLVENDTNIEDQDQVEIMREVMKYLELDKSGVFGFNQMKKGWSELVTRINTGASLNPNDKDLSEAVTSWQQEERDIALILSRSLGVLVNCGRKKYKSNLAARLEEDKQELIDKHQLSSTLRINGAVSDIAIHVFFNRRTVEMHVSLQAPQDKTLRGQLGWMRRQLLTCQKKSSKDTSDVFAKLQSELHLELNIKHSRQPERISLDCFDYLYDRIKHREIKEFSVIQVKDFGKRFASRTKFVQEIEQMALDFYRAIVQYLTKWEPKAPQMNKKRNKDVDNDDLDSIDQKNTTPRPAEATAPCPSCGEALVLTTLHLGSNTCPHCKKEFIAE